MKNKRPFAVPDKFGTRMIMMILGIIVQAFGLSLLIRLELGTDPCTCLTLGVMKYIPIQVGTAQLICHLINFAIVLRFDWSMIGFGTIGNMVCLGYINQFFGYIWDTFLPADFFESNAVRYGLLIPVLAVFILGAAAYMTAGLGTSPYDAVPFIIADRKQAAANHAVSDSETVTPQKKLSFKAVRMIWDISYMAGGILLAAFSKDGFIFGETVGIVTVVIAFGLGPVISWMQKIMSRLLR